MKNSIDQSAVESLNNRVSEAKEIISELEEKTSGNFGQAKNNKNKLENLKTELEIYRIPLSDPT